MDKVAAAATQWRKDLIDFSARNPLLYYKDLKSGTLDLANSAPQAQPKLFSGHKVRLAELVETDDRVEAGRRLRTIYRKLRELDEERGIKSGFLALGMAHWDSDEHHPAAPLLLYPVEITLASSRQDDFVVELQDEPVVNPVLLEYLAAEFKLSISAQQFPIPENANPVALYDRVHSQLARLAASVPGFHISDRRVIGGFNYAKLPMVADLESAGELLTGNELIAAIAGDLSAQQALAAQEVTVPKVDQILPADEYLVLDADSSQSDAINAAVSGQNLVIKGPPGTGKSQTIANLVAALIARGQHVLFVAEKRAAIDTVVKRLADVGLHDLVLDAHDGAKARNRVLNELRDTLDRPGRLGVPDTDAVHLDLTASRAKLLTYRQVTHALREPWQVSAFQLRCTMQRLEATSAVVTRLADDVLMQLGPAAREQVAEQLRQFASLDGFRLGEADTAWWGADLTTTEQTRGAMALANRLHRSWPQVQAGLERLAAEVGVTAAISLSGWRALVNLVGQARRVEEGLTARVWTAPLESWLAATATTRWRKDNDVKMSWWQRRRKLREVKRLWQGDGGTTAEIHTAVAAAIELLAQWRQATDNDATPVISQTYDKAAAALSDFSDGLDELAAVFPATPIEADALARLIPWVAQLAADRGYPPVIQRLHEWRAELGDAGFADLVRELTDRRADPAAAEDGFQYCFASSLLGHLELTDQRFHELRGDHIPHTRQAFADSDRLHFTLNAQRVRRNAAERLTAARQDNPMAERFLQKQLGRKRNRASMRKLFEQGGEVLLELTPCVAMSPLVVSQLLPARRMFDVVVFDEASQVPVPDAIPSIMRGDRLVVTGDPMQLPPTSFFATADAEDGDDDADDLSPATGFQSILDSVAGLLPSRSLSWHYRSRDERLIGFSNRHIYGSSLTTFPGCSSRQPIRHILVPSDASDGDERSSTAEVRQVVELILEHAATTPARSLGVIAMSVKHALRIQAALDQIRPAHPELDEFFADGTDEPFFVKNLERVQGDERDAIIMSLGYRKGAGGQMRHHFGPINQAGGERRLNVAITRAKSTMTVVSTFGAVDLDPDRLHSDGARLLRAYLEYAESADSQPGTAASAESELNAFEADVRARLTAAGIPVVAQFGIGDYRVDFAAMHRGRPGHPVLAIESDGGSFQSAHSIRDRDRLRQRVLERIGWRVHRIWSANWWRDKDAEIAKAKAAYEAAETPMANDVPRKPKPKPKPLIEVVSDPPARDRGPCPIATGRAAITDYSHDELVSLIRWLLSDQRLRPDDAIQRQARTELGFRRNGSRIEAALTAAIDAVRSE